METTETAGTIHPWEKAGLGKAPFKFLGIEQQDLCYGQAILNRAEYQKTGILMTTKPGGSCAYCGTYIVQFCNIESADGKRFHVGSDCVAKWNIKGSKILTAVQLAKRKAKKMAADRRAADRIAVARGLLVVAAPALKAQPHPNAEFAKGGATLLDYVEWLLAHAGQTGKLRAATIIGKATAAVAP